MRECTDYEGRRIRLTDERLAHILEHPEMVGMESRIGETLANPEKVLESLSDAEARLYYRYYLGTRVGNKYLAVVVKVQDADAFVVTAYLTDKVKSGKLLWPKES
jgi:hypothetical protein